MVDRKRNKQLKKQLIKLSEKIVFEEAINQADDETTEYEDSNTDKAKADKIWKGVVGIDSAHGATPTSTPLAQRGKNNIHAAISAIKRVLRAFSNNKKRVTFSNTTRVATFQNNEVATVFATYDSGADRNYVREEDRKRAGWRILRQSARKFNVVNGGQSKGNYVTAIPIPGLSRQAAEDDTFDSFPQSLVSVVKTNNDSNVSIFKNTGITVHKEDDVLIICKGAPIMIDKRDKRGRYRIPLMQHRASGSHDSHRRRPGRP